MDRFKVICEKDNVAVALEDLKPHTFVNVGGSRIEIVSNIPFGHKFAISDIPANGKVIKYCEEIGVASSPIRKGDHVHIHNLASTRARRP